MSQPEVLFVPEMSHDPRVRVYRGSRVRHRSNGLPGPAEFDGMEVDSYLLITERFLLVCDTMIGPEDMSVVTQSLQGELTRRPLLVMNSHADWDHAWGNSYFTGERAVPILGHEHCRRRMNSEKDQTFLANFQRDYPNHFQSVILTAPTMTFRETLSLYGGDLTIELFHAPGHCQDHCAAWIPELHLLLAFDAVEAPIPFIKSVIGAQSMFTTLEAFLRLHPQWVLCSHGRTTSPALIQANLSYFREVERRCRATLTHHLPTATELEHAAGVIGYPFDEVIAQVTSMIALPDPFDRAFYESAHDTNCRHMMQWLLN